MVVLANQDISDLFFSDTDGTFTSAKDSAAAAGISDLASIGISVNEEYAMYGLEVCEFKCPYQEWILRSLLNQVS